MIDLSATSQLNASTRSWMLPGLDVDSEKPWELAPGRVLVARVLEVQGDMAVLAWGRHRLTAHVQPPLNTGSAVMLQVQEASDRRLSLRLIGSAEPGAPPVPSDSRAQLLLALGLVDDARNRAIVASLARAGRAVTAAEVRGVRQALAQLGAPDEDAPGIIWLRRLGLPLSPGALELARALQDGEPTRSLWQTIWARLSQRYPHDEALHELATRFPLVKLDQSDTAQLAAQLEQQLEDLATPAETKLARAGDAESTTRDARTVLEQMRELVAHSDHARPRLEEALTTLQRRLEAQQLSNAVHDGPFRVELPLIIDEQLGVATLLVEWQAEHHAQTPPRPPEPRLTLELELSKLGQVRVELARQGRGLHCWLAIQDEAGYRLLQGRTTDLFEQLERVTGWAPDVRCFRTHRQASPLAAELRPIDVRT